MAKPGLPPFASRLQGSPRPTTSTPKWHPSAERAPTMRPCLFVALLFSLQLLLTRGIASIALQRLPATIAHELAHFMVALVCRAHPRGFSLIPKRVSDNSWQLGAVIFTPGTFSAGFVALAPLWVNGPLCYWILWLRPESNSLLYESGFGLMGGIAAWASVPSSSDWSIALRYPAGTAIVCTALGLVLA